MNSRSSSVCTRKEGIPLSCEKVDPEGDPMKQPTFSRRMALLCMALAQLLIVAPSAVAEAATREPAAPQPTAAVQKLLEEAARLVGAKEFPGGLKAADDALAAARGARDGVGLAQAQEARARALEGLH